MVVNRTFRELFPNSTSVPNRSNNPTIHPTIDIIMFSAPPPPDPASRPQAVALVSGGKDSFLSLTHAIHNGYRIVALCNLHPPLPSSSCSATTTTTVIQPNDPASLGASPASGSDELDSYMYQTIGHTVLPLYSRALGLPLYRQPITGTAVDVGLNYQQAASSSTTAKATDETEDLYTLLHRAKQDFPGLRAVTSGAILSSYQRTRVESVCRRLNLVSLAYLWQLPQPTILSSLAHLGWDARIVKVAALGMDDSWLWWNLADDKVQRRLHALSSKWGINVAGEGGEFESLVVRAKGWRGRIEVGDEGRRVVKEEEGGGAVWVQFDEARVVEEEDGEKRQEEWASGLPVPELLDEEFRDLIPAEKESRTPFPASSSSQESTNKKRTAHLPLAAFSPITHQSPSPSSSSSTSAPPPTTITIANLAASTPHELLTRLFSLLPKSAVVTTIHISLPDISLFPALNAAYSPFFPNPLPPSRVCVASPALSGDGENTSTTILCHATAAVVPSSSSSSPTTATPYQQTGLHVQSRSYWAPSNIGPYSQATLDPSREWWHIAGQIPLVPASMSVLPREEGVETAVALALQHLLRIVEAVDADAEALGLVVYVSADGDGDDGVVDAVLETVKKWKHGVEVLVVGAVGLPMDAPLEVVGVVASSQNKRARVEVVYPDDGQVEEVEKPWDVTGYVDVGMEKAGETVKGLCDRGVKVVPACGVWGSDGKRRGGALVRRIAGAAGGYGDDDEEEDDE